MFCEAQVDRGAAITVDRRLDDSSDAVLLELCARGRSEAWEVLVRRYRRLVYSVPLKLGLRVEEAEEVFQDTFVSVFEKLDTVRDRKRIAIWLAVTARRKALNRLTRGPAKHEVALPERLEPAVVLDHPVDELAFSELDPRWQGTYFEHVHRTLTARFPIGRVRVIS